MTTIRDALDTYPLRRWLRRGPMDLIPSLAKHLERETAKPETAPDPGEPVRRLIGQIDELISEWRTQAMQIESNLRMTSLGGEHYQDLGYRARVVALNECANELDQLLNEGKP